MEVVSALLLEVLFPYAPDTLSAYALSLYPYPISLHYIPSKPTPPPYSVCTIFLRARYPISLPWWSRLSSS
eukprot:3418987-Rhodomonas_salina.1